MPNRQWFPRAVTARGPTLLDGPGGIATSSGLTVTGSLTLSSGIDYPLSSGASTGTDLLLGLVHTVIAASSDGGYYLIDPPATPGMTLTVIRSGTTASTSYFVPDATGVHIHTSSGSTGGRLITVSGGGTFELLAQTTASWLIKASRGNVACTSST